ncbi:hypothetical protein BDW02DRAFT_567693 [Decorospora gaudefroyi]|uniref:Uncharacterized protein n=1 Tax=Decorospora gaudefroyi TaxID=184978 RepID=A0A6A5KI43_9PLEO|nr:hypothetical protein BDW02DRAFT_567693 [Decorospora gaudefroyi]
MPGDEEARIALTPRRPRFMPGDDERQRAPLDSHDRFPGLSSLQWTTANNPRLARRDIQYQLGKTTEALSKAKAELQAREKLAKMSVQQSPGDAELEVESKKEVEREKLAEAHRSKKPVKQSTEEDEVEVKAREDKEKEKVAEARRAKKNARRENWAKKLAQDFERREAKRQEKALRLKDGEGVEGIAGKGTAEAAEKNGVRN